MKLVGGVAALFCMIAPAIAWDADPKSFRANPEAWVRNVLVPGCKAPCTDKDVAQCDCMVPLFAAKTTEADVARVNDPDFKRTFGRVAIGVAALCMPR